MITIASAWAATKVPSEVANINTVQDGVSRLKENLRLAEQYYTLSDEAPSYVSKAVDDLNSWIEHARAKPY